MKSKHLLLMLLLAFALPWAAMAQETLTVCQGDEEEQHIPIYAYSGDTQGTTSEFIIPASNLTALNGKEVTALKFYLSQSQSKTWTAVYQVYMAEVEYTTLSETIGPDEGTIVYEGTVDASGSELTITFNQGNYTYNGGNLLIGTYVATAGAWDSNGKFYGIEASEAAYLSGSWGGYDDGSFDFIPQTTFTYLTDDPYITLAPASATVITGFTTTLTATYGNVTGTPSITYSSSDEGVAKVSGSGATATVLGIAPGTATITATMNDLYTATCAITVEDPSYCTPYYSYSSDYIDSFTTTGGEEDINNTSGAALSYGYSDFYDSHYLSAEPETTIGFSVIRGYNDSYKYAIWVDWDRDYEFEETEIMASVTTAMKSDWEGEFTIPAGTAVGDYRMRVEMLYGSSNTLNPCVSASYGEVEDYKLTVLAATGCHKPTNLSETQVGTTTAVLNWEGENDSYVLQYRTAAYDMNMNVWQQQGDDIEAPGTFTQLSFDLSAYSGTGYIAIRHYACSGQWQMTIDDIMVTNDNNETVFEEDFEDGSIPTTITNLDYDGDGYSWQIANFGTDATCQNGGYCVMSASYNNYDGDLYPDNWLIIPDVELGGTLSFYVASTDASWPENFGVFVATQSYEGAEAGEWSADIPVATTSKKLTGLTASTAYDWQVKGICGTEPSNWASSSFTTIAEGFKTFVTAGNWDVADNWFPEGVPAITDEVSITKAANIPAGVVAQAKKATIETGGSITIKDGGQLKQGSATLKVTMEKEITGYGESTNKDHYYFIATPLTGSTAIGYNSAWNYVYNLNDGDYDFYAFDASEVTEEWQNYEAYSFYMYPGEGYLYANKADKTLQFIGTVKGTNNPTTIDYTYDGESTDPFNGWALVGNPYTCNAYINYVNGENVLAADFYTLNANGDTYVLSESSVALPPLTGAFINVGASGTVKYTTEAPAGKGTGMLDMTLSQGRGSIDQARVRFGQGYNMKHMSFRNNSSIYMPVDGNDYAVVYSEKQGEMPVNFKAENNGSYSLSFNTENVEFGYLHLIDNMTGADVNLLETPSYSFEAKTSDYASRFKLVFSANSTVSEESFAFMSDGNLIVNNEGNATLQVIDVNGRILRSESINGSASINMNTVPGVYMIRVINGENVKTQKMVVR